MVLVVKQIIQTYPLSNTNYKRITKESNKQTKVFLNTTLLFHKETNSNSNLKIHFIFFFFFKIESQKAR
mgnify:CR=1 FL=1